MTPAAAPAMTVAPHPESPQQVSRYHVKSFGCQMNVYDSERMGDVLAADGHTPADSAESADPAKRSDGEQHGVTPPTVVRELRQAGFELVAVEDGIRRSSFMVVMRRP